MFRAVHVKRGSVVAAIIAATGLSYWSTGYSARIRCVSAGPDQLASAAVYASAVVTLRTKSAVSSSLLPTMARRRGLPLPSPDRVEGHVRKHASVDVRTVQRASDGGEIDAARQRPQHGVHRQARRHSATSGARSCSRRPSSEVDRGSPLAVVASAATHAPLSISAREYRPAARGLARAGTCRRRRPTLRTPAAASDRRRSCRCSCSPSSARPSDRGGRSCRPDCLEVRRGQSSASQPSAAEAVLHVTTTTLPLVASVAPS